MSAAALDRLSTGLPGLDDVLGGGLFKAGVYMVQGAPGTGKTTLANQICFAHVAGGGRALYVTLLSEAHARMLQHLRTHDFFDEAAIPDRLYYVSAFNALETEGLKGLNALLRHEMKTHRASMVALDGFVSAAESADTARELKKMVNEIQGMASLQNCTFLLMSSGRTESSGAEHTMVDGLIELDDRLFGVRAERSIQIRKFRGGDSVRGRHAFEIGQPGIEVFPRFEALFGRSARADPQAHPLPTGVGNLDRMIAAGGWPASSVTVITGPTGIGKTTLGLQFLAASSAEQPGLLFSFFESPDFIRSKARSLGLPFDQLEEQGHVAIAWQPQAEHSIDKLAYQLLAQVRARGVKRLVIDGLAGFFESAVYPERSGRFFACLANELRRQGVAALMTSETRDAVASAVPTPYGVSALVDNLVFLRFVESEGDIKRLLSILKVRNSEFDSGTYAFEITSSGIHVQGRYTTRGDVMPRAEPIGDKWREEGGHTSGNT